MTRFIQVLQKWYISRGVTQDIILKNNIFCKFSEVFPYGLGTLKLSILVMVVTQYPQDSTVSQIFRRLPYEPSQPAPTLCSILFPRSRFSPHHRLSLCPPPTLCCILFLRSWRSDRTRTRWVVVLVWLTVLSRTLEWSRQCGILLYSLWPPPTLRWILFLRPHHRLAIIVYSPHPPCVGSCSSDHGGRTSPAPGGCRRWCGSRCSPSRWSGPGSARAGDACSRASRGTLSGICGGWEG